MDNRLLYPLDRSRCARLQLKVVPYQRLNRIGDNNCTRWGGTRDPCRHVGGQSGKVAVASAQIHQTPVHPDPDINAETESPLRLITEPQHLPRDLQPGLHRAARIVVTRVRMTEHRQQPITLGGADMPVVSAHDAHHLFAVSPDDQVIRLGLHPRGQRRRIHQIGKEQGQPPDLTDVSGVCQHTFGIGRTVSHLDIVSSSAVVSSAARSGSSAPWSRR